MNDLPDAAASAPPAAPTAPAPTGRARSDGHDRILLSLIAAARTIEERLESELAAAGLSAAKLRILAQLAQADSPLAFSELAECQRCVRSNITQIVDRLETEGLVRRVDDPVDRRIVRAQLTASGRERHARGAAIFQQVQAQLAAALPRAERDTLERALAALNALPPHNGQD
jgi:DNA-binding MarR family transcriptional regulator